jgi:dihydrofolate reductase
MLEGAEVAHSVADTVKLCANNDESFVIGGAQVYAAFLHIANKLYLTRVKKSFEADTFFPVIDFDHWQLKSATPPQIDDNSNLEFVFEVYERVK